MKRFVKSLTLILAGLALSFPIFSLDIFRTSTPHAWWHGFYECKKRYNGFMQEARHLVKEGKPAYKATDFPNATGRTTKPEAVFGAK